MMGWLSGKGSSTTLGFLAAGLLAAALAAPAQATVYTWALGDAGGEWTTTTNWNPTGYPNAADDTATFSTAVTADRTVTQASDVTVNKLEYTPAANTRYLSIGTSARTITFAGTSPTIQSNANCGGWAAVRINSKVDVGTGGVTVTSTGTGNRGTRLAGGVTGSGDVTIDGGSLELSRGSGTFTGEFIINSNAVIQVVSNASNTPTALGDTAHGTEINGTGFLRFRGASGTCSEPIEVNGISRTGSIDMYVSSGLTINGPVTLNHDASFGIHDWASGGGAGVKRDFSINSVIADGTGGPHNVYFLGNLSSASAQGTESRKGEMILGAVSTYGGDTYLTTNKADDGSGTFSGNLRLGIDNPLPIGTTLTLGGSHTTAGGTLGTGAGNAKFALGGHDQELAGLLTNGTGTQNRVVGNSATLSTLTLNIASATTNSYGGYLGWSDTDDNNLALVKTGDGTLVLTKANTYEGPTTVDGGTLRLGANEALGTGDLTVDQGATLEMNGFDQSVDVLRLKNGTIDGAGTLTLSSTSYLTKGVINANLAGNLGTGYGLQIGGDNTATVELNGYNTYKSGTFQTLIGHGVMSPAGIVKLGNSHALGDATNRTYLYSGTLDLNGKTDVATLAIYLWSGGATLINSDPINPASTDATVYVRGTNSDVGGAGDLTLKNIAQHSGGGNLHKIGTGTLTITGTSTHTGVTTVSAGVLAITNPTALGSAAAGTTVATGASLEVSGGITCAEPVTLNGGGYTPGWYGALRSTGGDNTWSGPITLATSSRIGCRTANTFTLTGGITGNGSPLFVGTSSGSGSIIRIADTPINVTGSLYAIDNNVTLIDVGGNSWGNTYITYGGTLRLGLDDAAPTSTVVNIGTTNNTSGTLDLYGHNQTIAGLRDYGTGNRRVVNTAGGTPTLAVNNSTDYTFGGNLGIAGQDSFGLAKSGGAVFTLTNTNTFSGATLISAGTLALSGAGSIDNSPTITVGLGAVFDVSGVSGDYSLADGQTLTGSGSVVGAVTIADGSTISPGDCPGTISMGDTTWAGGGDYLWEINDFDSGVGGVGNDPGWDLLNIAGTLTISATEADPFTINLTTLKLNNDPGPAAGALELDDSFEIARTSGGIIGFHPDKFVLDTSDFDFDIASNYFRITQEGNRLYLNYVPEPATMTLLGLGVLGLLARRRRR